jgi:tape measure domain-containing protein
LNLNCEEADRLNENPSEETLQILAKGSGQTLERLREMTWTGMIKKRDE